MLLANFLENKPLFYDVIDTSRMPAVYQSIKHHFKTPIIVHLVGTNGKGTTGRFLAQMLLFNGLHVGHYTSPHITMFNERIWIDGENVHDDILERYHLKLSALLSDAQRESLSYFEYTTLLAMLIFCDTCEYVVLEAGLGGEFDATNVFEKKLSIITPIGMDHQAFLGNDITSIAQTKLNSVRNDFIVAKQYEKEVYTLAYEKSLEIKKHYSRVDECLNDEIYSALDTFVSKSGYPLFLGENFATAFCALRHLGYDIDLNSFRPSLLQGRCQMISSHITVDVGHNVMAARSLREHFGEKKVVLVYNTYKDKDYEEILAILKPIISEIQVIDIVSPRVVEIEKLFAIGASLGIKISTFVKIKERIDYLVFGSFAVVEAFMKENKFEK